MLTRCGLRFSGGGSKEKAVGTLAFVLTTFFACLCIALSWYMLLIKSRMVRDSKRGVLNSLEGLSILFAYIAHSTLLRYTMTHKASVVLVKLSRFSVSLLYNSVSSMEASSAGAYKRNEDATSVASDGLVRSVSPFATSGDVRERGVHGGTTKNGVSPGMSPPGRHLKPLGPNGSSRPHQAGIRALSLMLFIVLLAIHVIVHAAIIEKHRQSQEIVLALVRCSVDIISVVLFVSWSVVRVLRMNASHNPQLQRTWSRIRLGIVGCIGALFLVFLAVTVKTVYSVDPVPHLRMCILDDRECDPCEAEGMQLNPMMKLSWVWPAITPRRLFTFYSGSEKCQGSSWRPIAYLDEPHETLVVSALCADGTKPHIYLHRPENNELHGRDDFSIVEVRAGNKQYHRDLESWYGTEEKARATGVTVNRDPETRGILSVELTPSSLHATTREPASDAEKEARRAWPSQDVFEVALGASTTYIVRCPSMDHEEYYMFPMKSTFQAESKAPQASSCLPGAPGADGANDPDELAKDEPAGSVLVLFFDAVSRQAVRRSLPKFAAWLHDFQRRHSGGGTDGHMVFEPRGHTTLGISTAGNMAPMLSGATYEASDRMGTEDVDIMEGLLYNVAKKRHGDLIHNTMTVGYCHDLFEIIFGNRENSSGYGGPIQGVDHYLYEPMCHLEYSGLESNFQGPYSIIRRCIDNRHVHEYLFDYTEYMLKRQMARQREIAAQGSCAGKRPAGKFFFDWLYLLDGHEGTHTAITLVDDAVVAFMNKLENELRFFDNPLNVFLLAADHGNHMGHYFEFTYAGRFERTTPAMLFVMHPEVFRRIDIRKGRMPGEALSNFITRTHHVTTPLDIYRTLGDILGVDAVPFEGYMRAKVSPVSMFDARSGPAVHQCRDFSTKKEFYICSYHYCTGKEDAAAAVAEIDDY